MPETTIAATDATKAYVAVCQHCKRIIGAMSAPDPTHPGGMSPKERGKEIAVWMSNGLDVQRMTNEEVRSGEWGHIAPCPFFRPAKKAKS